VISAIVAADDVRDASRAFLTVIHSAESGC
jgi:hypothetical protein